MVFAAGACLAGPAAWSETLLEREGYRPLVADQRALRPGDNLTVLITESATAPATANTTTNKEGSGSLAAAATGNRNGGTPYGPAIPGSVDLTQAFHGGRKMRRTRNRRYSTTV